MQTITHTLKNFYNKIPKVTIPVAIILGAILISFSHITYGLIMVSGNGQPQNLFLGRPVDESDLATGNTDSDVIVVEYSDTECTFCAQLQPTIKKIQQEFDDKVSFVYRYFPLTNIHPGAFAEAQAVHCVGEQLGAEKRREYINAIFDYKIEKQNLVLPVGGKEALAKNLGVNEKEFIACLESEESFNVVNDSLQEGIAAKVEGTPATYILRKKGDSFEVVSFIEGARPESYFRAAIKDALSR